VKEQSHEKALIEIIERRLREGALIEIGGMGSFELNEQQQVIFKASGEPLVFLSYALEDRNKITKLYRQLRKAGLEPWMDCQKLMPGQNWPRAIHQTIEIADFFIGCFSKRSTSKRGHFQGELHLAWETARQFPEDDVYFIPIRLEECDLPKRISSETHYVDLFPNWNLGVKKLIAALRRHQGMRKHRKSS